MSQCNDPHMNVQNRTWGCYCQLFTLKDTIFEYLFNFWMVHGHYDGSCHNGSIKCPGWFFRAKSPTLGDKLLSNFPRGRGGAMGRGSFHAKVLVLFIKNGRLPLQLIERKYGGNAGGLSENVLWLCLLLADISGSLKILDNIGVILSTKVRKNIMLILLLGFHLLQALGAAKGFISLITK